MKQTLTLFYTPRIVRNTWNILFRESFDEFLSQVNGYHDFNRILDKAVFIHDNFYGEMVCGTAGFKFYPTEEPLQLRIRILPIFLPLVTALHSSYRQELATILRNTAAAQTMFINTTVSVFDVCTDLGSSTSIFLNFTPVKTTH